MPRSTPIRRCIGAFHAFLADCEYYKTIATEDTVYTDRYAGTRDWKVELKWKEQEGIYTIDFKTSARLYPEYRWQVSAYASVDGTKPGLLRLDKQTGEYEFKCEGMRGWSQKMTIKYYRKFIAYVDLYYSLKGA